jgi:hypothetical protein
MRINNAFLFGFISGLGVGYYLATNDKEEIMEDLKSTASRLKDKVSEGLDKGKQWVEDMKAKQEKYQ